MKKPQLVSDAVYNRVSAEGRAVAEKSYREFLVSQGFNFEDNTQTVPDSLHEAGMNRARAAGEAFVEKTLAAEEAALEATAKRYADTRVVKMQASPALVLHFEVGDADRDGRCDVTLWASLFGKSFAPFTYNLPADMIGALAAEALKIIGGTPAVLGRLFR